MSLPADSEIDALLANIFNEEQEDKEATTHVPNIDPYYVQSFSWNRLHEEKAVKIQNAYRKHVQRMKDPLRKPIPVCEYKKCGNLLVFGQSRFCNHTCARKYSVGIRWDNETFSTPPAKFTKRCSKCRQPGHNKATCTNRSPLADVTNNMNDQSVVTVNIQDWHTVQQENQTLKTTMVWYQQQLAIMQDHFNTTQNVV